MAVKFQFRRDTAANWESNNPILSEGEFGLDLTNQRFKIGNGTDTWNALDNAQYTNKAETFVATTTIVGSDGSSDWQLINSGDWQGAYSVTKTVNGILETDFPLIELNLTNATNNTFQDLLTDFGLIFRAFVPSTNTIVFYAQSEPSLDLPIIIKVVR
jgi:hypothetical protein